MSKRKQHRPGLENLLQRYADSRLLDVKRYNGGAQLRIHDGGYVAVDFWLTGKYHVLQADYHLLTAKPVYPAVGKRGTLPVEKVRIGRLLDGIFFRADIIEEGVK